MRVRRYFSVGLSIIVIIAQLMLPLTRALASSSAMPGSIPQRPLPSWQPPERAPTVIPVDDDEVLSRPLALPMEIPRPLAAAAPRQTLETPLGTGNNNYGQTQRDTDNPQNHPGHHFAGSTNLVNGNLYLTAGDFFIPGRGLSLQLARSYNSLSAVPAVQTTTPVSETLEPPLPPPDWDIIVNAGACAWESTALLGVPNLTGGSGEAAAVHTLACGGFANTELRTLPFDLSELDEATLAFRTDFNTTGPGFGFVDISTNGVDWVNLVTYEGASVPGHHQVLDLTPYVGSPSAVVRFYYNSFDPDGWWQVDDVEITGMSDTSYVGAFGSGWTHSYETHIISETGGMTLTVREADGSLHDYSWAGPCPDPSGDICYASPPGLYRQLRDMVGGNYLLMHKNGTIQLFNDEGQLVEITDPTGGANQINLYHNQAFPTSPCVIPGPVGTLCAVEDTSAARSLLFEYDPGSGFILAVHEWLAGAPGRTIMYTYAGQDLVGVVYPEGAATYSYDPQHRMTSYVDPRQPAGVRKTDDIAYDDQNRVITHTIDSFFDVYYAIRYGQPAEMGVDYGAVTAAIVTDGTGQRSIVEFDTHANVVYEGDWYLPWGWIGKWWWWHPEYWWLLSQKVDANEHTTSYDYDAWGNTTAATNALGETQGFSWEPPHYETFASPDVTFGNVLSATNSAGVTTLYQYIYDPASGNTLQETQAFGTPDQSVAVYQNDEYGRLIFQIDNAGQQTQYGYDEFGNTTVVIDALSGVIHNGFDLVGRPISTTDQAGNETLYVYDESDRLLAVTDPEGGCTSYTYSDDGRDNLTQLVNANGVTTTYAYDSLDRLVSQSNSMGQTTAYEYDPLNRLISRTDADGRVTAYEYDAKSRMTRAEYYEAGAVEPYQLNEYRYDPAGNLIWMANENVRLTYEYDALDQRTRIDMWTPTWGVTRTLQLTRELQTGNLTDLSGPEGYAIGYEYDSLNRLTTVTDFMGDQTTYQYDPAGRKAHVTYPGGTVADYRYDLGNHLTQLTYALSGADPLSYTYEYDSQGNVTREVDEGEVYTYTYDSVSRVISSTGESQGETSFVYDAVGNRLSAHSAEGATDLEYDAHNRLLGAGDASFTYNEMGARTGSQLTADVPMSSNARGVMQPNAVVVNYQYDNDMRLIQAAPGLTFLYDPLGNLIGAVDDAGNYRYWLRDGEDIYVELDNNGDVLAQYTVGADGVLSMWRDAQSYVFLADGRGRVRRVLDPLTGLVVTQYGPNLVDPGSGLYFYNPIRVNGAWWFPEVGLACFGEGVFWDPWFGVFLVKAWPWLYWPFGPFHPWRPIFRFWPWPWPWPRPWGWPWPRPWPFLWPWPGAWVRPWVIWPFWPWGLRPWWPWWYWRAWWGWHWWGRWWCWHPWWWWGKWWWWPWWHPWWWWGYWWFPWYWWWSCWWWPWHWWWWIWHWWPWWWGGWWWWCWWWSWPWWWGWQPWFWPPIHGPPEVGDAPDLPYPSFRRNWGAVHGNWWYEWLGPWRDGEWDSEQVDADLYDDGVTLDLLNGALTFKPTVAYPWWSARYGPWGPLNVHGWADWNSDGDWDDPGEFIANWSGYPGDQAAGGDWPAGLSSLNVAQPFAVPDAAFAGGDVAHLWLRFRLDYAHNLESPRGYTRFGEVEDHMFTVFRPPPPDWDDRLFLWLDEPLVLAYTRVVSGVQVSIAPALTITPTWDVVTPSLATQGALAGDYGNQLTIEHEPFIPGQRYTVTLGGGLTYTGAEHVAPASFSFDVAAESPDGVSISGPKLGGVGQDYTFSADVTPPYTITRPITYTWQASEQTDVITSTDATSHSVSYTWPTTGVKTITVTAMNALDAVSATHLITISAAVPPDSVTIDGPDTGEIGQSYAFSADVEPDAATPPITYTWQATGGQTDVVTTTDATSHSVSYTWDTAGVQAITVTARNAVNAVAYTHHITISGALVVPPDTVTINGLDTGELDTTCHFTATADLFGGTLSGTVSLPLTFVWQATGQTDVVTTTDATSHAVAFTWSLTGTKRITVTATNAGGSANGTHSIDIVSPYLYVYLPLVLKDN